jgi:hypothetical protein
VLIHALANMSRDALTRASHYALTVPIRAIEEK